MGSRYTWRGLKITEELRLFCQRHLGGSAGWARQVCTVVCVDHSGTSVHCLVVGRAHLGSQCWDILSSSIFQIYLFDCAESSTFVVACKISVVECGI